MPSPRSMRIISYFCLKKVEGTAIEHLALRSISCLWWDRECILPPMPWHWQQWVQFVSSFWVITLWSAVASLPPRALSGRSEWLLSSVIGRSVHQVKRHVLVVSSLTEWASPRAKSPPRSNKASKMDCHCMFAFWTRMMLIPREAIKWAQCPQKAEIILQKAEEPDDGTCSLEIAL